MHIDNGKDIVSFNDLHFGKCFYFEGGYYMKINNTLIQDDYTLNAIVIGDNTNDYNSGKLCTFGDVQVEAVEIKGKVVG